MDDISIFTIFNFIVFSIFLFAMLFKNGEFKVIALIGFLITTGEITASHQFEIKTMFQFSGIAVFYFYLLNSNKVILKIETLSEWKIITVLINFQIFSGVLYALSYFNINLLIFSETNLFWIIIILLNSFLGIIVFDTIRRKGSLVFKTPSLLILLASLLSFSIFFYTPLFLIAVILYEIGLTYLLVVITKLPVEDKN